MMKLFRSSGLNRQATRHVSRGLAAHQSIARIAWLCRSFLIFDAARSLPRLPTPNMVKALEFHVHPD